MASTQLTRTAGTASNTYKATISAWVKRAKTGTEHRIFTGYGGFSNQSVFLISDEDRLGYHEWNGSSFVCNYYTNRLLRDTSAWYHLMVAIDTTLSTATDRVKIYINGLEQRANGGFSTDTQIAQNTQLFLSNYNSGQSHNVGARNSDQYFDGLMTHFHFIDGTAYDASAFGETDATTGIWKPKLSPSVTYGNNGFFLKFNEGAFGTDSSPNGNNFTVNGSLTPTKDTPENVFATLNPLVLLNDNLVLSGGNLTASKASGGTTGGYFSTLGASSGKYYWEAKCIATGGSDGWIGIGQDRTFRTNNGDYPGDNTYTVAIGHTGTLRYSGSNVGSYTASSWTAGDIISVALDLDNNYVYFAKNGTWMNSGVPTSGATGTGGYTNATIFDGSLILSVNSLYQSGGDYDWNFGNGYFGTTPVSSATTDESGLGIFEYTVPSGYYALCTKNINTQEYA